MDIKETQKALNYLLKRNLEKQYYKVKGYLQQNQYSKVKFEKRQPKSSGF